MNKEFLKSIWILIVIVMWVLLLAKTSYEWLQGKEPDNFVVMVIILITISLENKFNNRKQ